MRRNVLSFIALCVFATFAAGTGDADDDRPPSRGSSHSTGANQAPTAALPSTPADQTAFCDTVSESARQYESSKSAGDNQLKLSKLKATRAAALKKLGLVKGVKGWVGTIEEMRTNGEGKASLTVNLPCGVQVKTWNNAVSDIGSNTLIPQSSPVYDALSNLGESAVVRFSGKFFGDNESGLREASMSERGGMTEPEFIFKFTEVQAHKP